MEKCESGFVELLILLLKNTTFINILNNYFVQRYFYVNYKIFFLFLRQYNEGKGRYAYNVHTCDISLLIYTISSDIFALDTSFFLRFRIGNFFLALAVFLS